MGPFDRFDDRAKRALALSQAEAVQFDHDFIGPEHLLIGLVREGEGVAATVLGSQGLDTSKARAAVEARIPRSTSVGGPPNEIVLTPETKHVIDLAVRAADGHGHRHVRTEDLLMGLLEEGTVADGLFDALGLSGANVKQGVLAAIAKPKDP